MHPGETPSSFVFNGFLNLLFSRDNPIAINLRRNYVFKLIPCLNPDGVARGHYRTDTMGVNLNRMYLKPSLTTHPSIYAARALLRYYHFGYEKDDEIESTENNVDLYTDSMPVTDINLNKSISHMTLEENKRNQKKGAENWCKKCKKFIKCEMSRNIEGSVPMINYNMGLCSGKGIHCEDFSTHSVYDLAHSVYDLVSNVNYEAESCPQGDTNCNESGLFLYIDMHSHASKKGIFMYGNHFQELEKNVECMMLPKIMSLNNHNFHFTACNFTERNMYLR